MSRPVAGVRNKTLILTLPGSPKGARENLQAIIKHLPHACQQLTGVDSRALHAGMIQGVENASRLRSCEATRPTSHQHAHSNDSQFCGQGHTHTVPRAHRMLEDRPATSNDPSAGPTARYRKSPYPMVSVNEALQRIAQHTPKPQTHNARIDVELVGAVLAGDVLAPEAVPAFRASIVDGYAITASNHIMVPSTKGIFPVVSTSSARAGGVPKLNIGEVARITTGAPLPDGATSVVMVEDTVLKSTTDGGDEEKEVEVLTDAIKPGENVREIGSDVEAGSVIMSKGERITATGGEFGLLASVGVREVEIYRRPIVGILSTGNEIVPFDREGNLLQGEVRDTNRPTLVMATRGLGYQAVDLGISPDT